MKAVVLFAGLGGLSLGVKRAGFEVVGFDVDAAACADHRRIAGPCEQADLETLTSQELRDLVAKHLGPGRPDAIFTSPPCKGFSGCLPSKEAKKEAYQRLNALSLRGIKLALTAWDTPPPFLALENVPRMKTRGKEFLAQITALLVGHGYAVELSTHDCGQVGGGAQHRRRLLLVARHRAQIPDLVAVRRPPVQRVRAMGEVLCELPLPLYRPNGSWEGGPLHRPVNTSALTALRLALIPPGGDWRSLPEQAIVHHGEPLPFDPRFAPNAATHPGARGVQRPDAPAHTVLGVQNTERGYGSWADPRLGLGSNTHNDTAHLGAWEDPASTVTGSTRPERHNGAVADPRVGLGADAHNGPWGVEPWTTPSHTVTASGHVRSHWGSVSDPRLTPSDSRHGAYGVEPWEQAASTVTGGRVMAHRAATADPRLAPREGRQFSQFGVGTPDAPSHAVVGHAQLATSWASWADPRLDNTPRAGTMGVGSWEQASLTVIGQARAEKGNVAADPRVTCKVREGAVGVCGWESAFPTSVIGWPVPGNGPWQVADPRGGAVRVDGYVVGASVWLRPGLEFNLHDKRAKQFVLLTWEPKTARWLWHRPLTTAELARLQDLPVLGDDGTALRLQGRSHTAWRERIGNAVPARAAEAIARSVARALRAAPFGFVLDCDPVWVAPASGLPRPHRYTFRLREPSDALEVRP